MATCELLILQRLSLINRVNVKIVAGHSALSSLKKAYDVGKIILLVMCYTHVMVLLKYQGGFDKRLSIYV